MTDMHNDAGLGGARGALPQTPTVPQDVLDIVGRLREPIVISHVVPDADALGSMLAVALALQSGGASAKVSLPPQALSQRLAFMFEWAKVPVATAEDFKTADGFIALDTAKKGRCNVGSELKQTDWSKDRPVVNIDHHSSNTRFADVNWIVPDAGSTCELAFFLLEAMQRPITPTMASLLYAGIQTDTLGFSLPTTSASTLTAAAKLAACGADITQLGERLCRSQRKSEFDLLRTIYASTCVESDGRIAYSFASYDDIHDAGCTAADIDDQITVPRSLDGVVLAMLFTEGNQGKTRINFRSSGKLTVVELANEFGGGGHSQAAGAILDCGVDEAIKKVVPRAIAYLSESGT